jgi:MEMO1 family protein
MMTNSLNRAFLILLFVLFVPTCRAQNSPVDRLPAVAGQFYPSDKSELNASIARLFSTAAFSKNPQNVVAVIAPHAGYVFSGEVAASSYNQINAIKEYENIFVIGSSHYVAFEGASIYRKGNFITPLGKVPVNAAIADELLRKHRFFNDRDDAHEKEHSIEVQLPFLQYRLRKHFNIVPIVIGSQSPDMCKEIADALRPYLTSKNLFVISTDFSHYPAYNDANIVDKKTGKAVESNSVSNFISVLRNNGEQGIPNLATSLCGWTSVLTLLYMTQGDPSYSYHLIEYKNSGDTPGGDKSRVVGYYSIAVTKTGKAKEDKFNLNDNDKQTLLTLARHTIEQYLSDQTLHAIDTSALSENAKKHCGAFVTLNKNGSLRGCIGRFEPNEPLYKVVQEMAAAAATQDYRFPPVEPAELSKIEIEISVLTPMNKISSINEIEMGKHGIYIKQGSRSGTFLPQVAKETGWSKEEFLGHCAQDKAGIGWDGWKDAELYTYEAFVFGEK